jgi:hypothetical protein
MNHLEEFLQTYIDNADDKEAARQEIQDAVETVVRDVSDDYTTAPEFIRIHDEGDGWAIDGATKGGRYTEAVWKYDTLEEAAENVPAYIRHIKAEGYTI